MKIESAVAYAELLLMDSDDKAITISRAMLKTLAKNAAPRIEAKTAPGPDVILLQRRIERQAQAIKKLEAEKRKLKESLYKKTSKAQLNG